MLLKPYFHNPFLCRLVLLFFIVCSIQVRADDKHKSTGGSEPRKSAPAPQVHQSGGSGVSHGNSGGNAARSSSTSTYHGSSNSNSNYGRTSGGNGAGSSNGAGYGNGRGSNNGGNSSGKNTEHPVFTGGNSVNRDPGRHGNPDGRSSGKNTEHPVFTNPNSVNRDPERHGYPDGRSSGKNTERPVLTGRDRGGNYPGPGTGANPHTSTWVHERVNGHAVARDSGGRVREIREVHDRRGREMFIHHDTYGRPRYVTVRAGGGRIVGFGHGRGFAERRYYAPGGRVYYQRTYVYGGRRYAVAYRYYPYRGVYYYGYAPAFYYRPRFYGWAYDPWTAPVYYRWGWGPAPWYGYYGYYFAPYPYYTNASFWLTDYLIAENLRLAYEAQANANAVAAAQYSAPPPGSDQVALSPEVKQMIADEVQRQLAAERAAAQQPPLPPSIAPAQGENAAEEMPAALDPNQKVFIVATNLDLAGAQGECTVTPGDILVRTGDQPDQNNKIAVTVISSKKGDCPISTNSAVETTELQEMHNHFREKLDNGLKTLADNSGKNGLPVAPDTSTVAGEVAPPQPDSNAANELEEQQKSAAQAEQEVAQKDPGGSQP
jgi:hypothetical protein